MSSPIPSALPDRPQADPMTEVLRRLERIETVLGELRSRPAPKEWYTTGEVAQVIGKAEYTVREWCRLARIRARKKRCGRGKAGEWLVSHEELTRFQNEGLLPLSRPDQMRAAG